MPVTVSDASQCACFWVTSGFGSQHLDRDLPLQDQVYRPPYLSRAARADQLIQTVAACQQHALTGDGSHHLNHVSSGSFIAGSGWCLRLLWARVAPGVIWRRRLTLRVPREAMRRAAKG